jgi:hypothetical protein
MLFSEQTHQKALLLVNSIIITEFRQALEARSRTIPTLYYQLSAGLKNQTYQIICR